MSVIRSSIFRNSAQVGCSASLCLLSLFQESWASLLPLRSALLPSAGSIGNQSNRKEGSSSSNREKKWSDSASFLLQKTPRSLRRLASIGETKAISISSCPLTSTSPTTTRRYSLPLLKRKTPSIQTL